MRILNFLFIIVSLLVSVGAMGEATTAQPKIMVIPKVLGEEDIRTVLEEDPAKRIVVATIKEAFDSRGFTTIDFLTKIKAISQQQAFNSENISDLKSQLIENSGADIYIEAEIIIDKSAAGNNVHITLEGNDISSGEALASKNAESGRFYTEDWAKLSKKALEGITEEFLNTLNMKFGDIICNGRTITISFVPSPSSTFSLSSEVGKDGNLLSDEIEIFMEENAYHGNFHIQGSTASGMYFDSVKIPLKDEKTGNNYTVQKFARELNKFFRNLGIPITRDIKGSQIFITIN